MGRLDEAVEQLRRAVRIQESGEATAYFRRSVEAKPGSAVARLGLMEGYLATGRTDLARAEYEALRRLNPELARAAGTVFGPGS